MSNKTHNTKHITPTTVLLVGGGTGGHIYPLYNLCDALIAEGVDTHLVVNDSSLDKKIVQQTFTPNLCHPEKPRVEGSPRGSFAVHYLKASKLHYHFSLENIRNVFRILGSFGRARRLLKTIKPDAIFFKGGFVGLPILIAAKFLTGYKGKIYLHESDISSGALTNFFGKYADKTFSNFGDDATPLFYWPTDKPGLEINKETDQARALDQILIFGGSQGAQFINELILNNVETLCEKYRVILVAGPGKKYTSYPQHNNLEVHEFLEQEILIEQIFSSSLVIARAGASLFQLFAAQKKCIAVPLPSSARNHQLHNAQYFSEKGLCYLLEQNKDTQDEFLPMVEKIMADGQLEKQLKDFQAMPKAKVIASIILA